MAQFSLLVFKIKVLFRYPDAQWRHQICQNRKISWIFFGMLPCVPIKSLPHFSLQKRENCVLLTTLILVLFLLILPCKKIGRRKRGEEGNTKNLFSKKFHYLMCLPSNQSGKREKKGASKFRSKFILIKQECF